MALLCVQTLLVGTARSSLVTTQRLLLAASASSQATSLPPYQHNHALGCCLRSLHTKVFNWDKKDFLAGSSHYEAIEKSAYKDQLLATPPTTGRTPITIKYPFHIDYYKHREVIVYDLNRKPLGIQHLDGNVFNVPVRLDLLFQNVRYLRFKWRRGSKKELNLYEVDKSWRKPWPQKGTGRAPAGTRRGTLFVGGAKAHAKRQCLYWHKMRVAMKRLAMKSALSAKFNERRLIVVDSLAPDAAQSKVFAGHLKKLMEGCRGRSALLIDTGERAADGGVALRRAIHNITWAHAMTVREMTVYHLLKFSVLIMSKAAAQALNADLVLPQRITRPVKYQWWLQQQEGFKKAAAEIYAAMD